MKNSADLLTFTVPLGWKAYSLAEEFSSRQHSKEKAKQVYFNTLAVYAVKFCLECMDVETNWEASDSWNPVMQTLMDVADLEIPDLGKLECRPILINSQVVAIPAEVWSERIGYAVVQIDESIKEATILGFVEKVVTDKLPIIQLRSLDDLLKHLNKFPESAKQPVRLGQWLKNIFEAGWQSLESLTISQPEDLAINFRGKKQLLAEAENSTLAVRRGQILDLGQDLDREWIALLVEVMPLSKSEMDITVIVCPFGGQTYLPSALDLMVLDEEGKSVMQAQARGTDNLQLKFSGEPKDRFSVKVILGNISYIEDFLV